MRWQVLGGHERHLRALNGGVRSGLEHHFWPCIYQPNQDAIARYTECIDDLPPVTVIEVENWGRDGSNMLLVDGFHRYAAHLEAGRKNIIANVVHGDTHGLPFTQENKQNMILHLIEALGEEVYEKRFGLDKKKLMPMTGTSDRIYSRATTPLRDRLEKERNGMILELHKDWSSQHGIAEAVGCSQRTVGDVLE